MISFDRRVKTKEGVAAVGDASTVDAALAAQAQEAKEEKTPVMPA